MQLKSLKRVCAIGMFILCIGMTAASPPAHAGQGIQTSQNGIKTSQSGHAVSVNQNGLVKLAAGGNPAICKANYDQCIKGCQGFAQCNNQCAANYRGCLGQ